jgi:hypothetical protein
MEIRTPLLIDVSTSFEEYIFRLSVTDKKKYKSNRKITSGYSFECIEYDPVLMRQFIALWETQTVYGGKSIKWYRPMEFMDCLDTLVMFKIVFNSQIIGLHCLEKCGELAYGHPPLYDKNKYPHLARFSWFSMIRFLCESSIKHLDLDAGFGRDWQTLLIERHSNVMHDAELHNLAYKWFYVPKDVKDNPEKEIQYLEFRCSCNWKQLVTYGKFSCEGHRRKIGNSEIYALGENTSPTFTLNKS